MLKELGVWPFFDEDEKNAVQQVLESGLVNYWTGEECRDFEREYAAYLGRKHAIAVFNGTVALELALFAYDIGVGDEVIVTSRTFIASASCAVMRGATPVCADVDHESQNVTAKTIAEKITPKTRAIICVHLAGWPCDMDPIMELAARNNLIVIEDCAQAHGARYKERPVGSIGHIAAFSFCQDKIMTTGGEGGIMVTDDEEIYKKCWAFKDHGKSYDAVYNREHEPGFRWLHESFGTNWRMTEMQAAIGRCQLRKLDSWINKRRANAAKLNEAFSHEKALRLTIPGPEIYHAYYKYYVFVRSQMLKSDWNRDRIMDEINAAGIPCFSGSCSEIYLEKAFQSIFQNQEDEAANGLDSRLRGNDGGEVTDNYRLPVARKLGETSLMFLVHPTLSQQNIDDTIRVIKDIMAQATKID
jgi:dTDP-4-amino-4,6-dideoxygalactose transaminase